MIEMMKKEFILAYTQMYGESKKKAEGVFRRAMQIEDFEYIMEIIRCVQEDGCKQINMFGGLYEG